MIRFIFVNTNDKNVIIPFSKVCDIDFDNAKDAGSINIRYDDGASFVVISALKADELNELHKSFNTTLISSRIFDYEFNIDGNSGAKQNVVKVTAKANRIEQWRFYSLTGKTVAL